MESKRGDHNPKAEGEGVKRAPVMGGCLCGAVRFAITLPTKWCAHCHCSMCRRAHGAPYVTWVGVPSQSFQIVEGENRIVRYRSSEQATRSFCGTCGSPMLFESTRWPGEVHVALGCVVGPIDQAPAAHVFFNSKADWVHVSDDLPRMGGSTGIEPLPG